MADRGAAARSTTGVEVSSGKPTHAEIHMHTIGCGGTAWYFDPFIGSTDLPDDSDFSQLVTPFVARRLGNDNMQDFYMAVAHEIGHALGIAAAHPDLRIHNYLSNALMPDPVNPGGPGDPGDVLYSLNINAGPIEATFTSAGSGGPGNLFPAHLYEGPITLQTAMMGLPVHPQNLMNDGRSTSDDRELRKLIPDFTAELLRDIYNYTITLPSTINTFYANLNRSNDDLIVRGDPDNADDVIAVDEVGSDLRVRVNGTSERIATSAMDQVYVFGEGGDDYIHIDQTPVGLPVSVNGGIHDDVLTIANASGNLTFVDGDVSINGGPGNDILNIQDLGRTGDQTYFITSSSITPSGLGLSIDYLNLDTIFLQGDQGNSIFNIDGVAFQTTMHLYGQGGDDTFNVGGVSLFPSLDGIQAGARLTTNGGSGEDVIRFNDGAHIASETYRLSDVSLSRSGLTNPLAYANMEDVSLVAGSGNDAIDIVRTTVPTSVNGNGGSDVVEVGAGDIDSHILSDLTLLGGVP